MITTKYKKIDEGIYVVAHENLTAVIMDEDNFQIDIWDRNLGVDIVTEELPLLSDAMEFVDEFFGEYFEEEFYFNL